MAPIAPKLLAEYRDLRKARAAARPLTRTQRALFKATRRGAERRNIDFELTEPNLEILIARAGGRCEMTRIAFNDERHPGLRVRPFRMSVDRLDNAEGYRLENCRLVGIIANLARGMSNLDLAHVVFLEYARNMGATIPGDLVASRDGERWQY